MKLKQTDLEFFRSRFSSFDEGVVDSVELLLWRPVNQCRVKILAHDPAVDSGRSMVEFVVSNLDMFKFDYGEYSFTVLTSGLKIAWKDGLVYLVFNFCPEDELNVQLMEKNESYVVGAECEWHHQPYFKDNG
jgi:hypothetical protein